MFIIYMNNLRFSALLVSKKVRILQVSLPNYFTQMSFNDIHALGFRIPGHFIRKLGVCEGDSND